jgi:parallel beta-helix repeat protein
MGIHLDGASHVTVSGLTIADCWGDCIYIGGDSKNIEISDCHLRGSRRQGVSIVKADSVTISNCRIADISGTNPQYAIDIEPNKRCVVDNVLIENVTVTGCEGGFRAVIGKEEFGNARIGKVEILNCNVMAKSRQTIFLGGCDEAVVNNCVIETRKGEKPILSRKVGHMSEMNNKVIYK